MEDIRILNNVGRQNRVGRQVVNNRPATARQNVDIAKQGRKSNIIKAGEQLTREQIVARKTSHRSPVHDAVFPLGIVAQIGSSQMLNGVQGAWVKGWFAIGLLHANVECGDNVATHIVLARNVYTAQQTVVIDCKAWYLLHIIYDLAFLPFYLFTLLPFFTFLLFYL